MFCQKCGKEIKDDAMFCQSCGQPVSGTSKKVELKNNNVNNNKKVTGAVSSILNDSKKLMMCGIGIIVILLFVVLMLAFGGKSDSKTAKNNAKEAESPLSEIMGEWERKGTMNGIDAWANLCKSCQHISVVPEGIKGFMAIHSNGDEVIYYTINASDVEVKEEDGVKYYYYTANMETKDENHSIIHVDMQNRLFINEDGYLQNQVFDSRDGYFQSISKSERVE